ncbi:MAG: hypothetical protein JJT78_10425 [Leptospira sp.]|nr:hypothetical protein [Leptospira sp.]
MKNIKLILITISLLAGACSSGDKVSQNPVEVQRQKEVVAKIQSIDERLAHYSVPDEEKHKLKLDKAKLLLDNGAYDEATTLLKEVLKAKSQSVNDSEVQLYLGKAYYGKSDYGNAISYLSQSEKLDRNYSLHERKKMIAHSLYEEEEYYPALAALGKAYRSPSVKKDQFFYETAAQSYYKMGYNNKSIEYFKKSLQVSELGLKDYPNSQILQHIQKESLEALGPINK